MAEPDKATTDGPNVDERFSTTRRDLLTGAAALGLLWVAPSLPVAAQPTASLEAQVNDYIQRLRRQGKISSDERTAWSVYDFTRSAKLVSINEETPLQAASMIKPFIALAYFYLVESSGGRIRYTSEIRRLMEHMICHSNNWATNRLIDLVSQHSYGRGAQDVERVLKNNAAGIFQQTRIVERIPNGGRTYRNLASARDYSRFLWALWNDRLPYAGELRDLMALPNRDRMARSVATIPDSVRVYHKTGSTAHLCGDMGIIEAHDRNGRRYPYTFIGIIQKTNRANSYGTWISSRGNVIRQVSDIVYRAMRAQHQLV
ncbi:serine hydrolase [Thiococcus pfennigii]|jgi:beta-lactamase class A|uniref:serine hydrolase n=1 Tax=Thiococcus pfennigii TaxID=1057 RepID=UPI0019079E6B|nr:serine hydrolase [Thiococcus pfennigii]MBK1702232.1 serine hydrolase [Thiococcus pfennigii]MBK1731371.1 serine hydrolase [Thiococcus pfennigii]